MCTPLALYILLYFYIVLSYKPSITAMLPQDPSISSPSYTPLSQHQQPISDEEQMYQDKLRDLSVYREPLKKMISDMTKDNRTQQTEYKKLVALLNALQPNPNQ